MPLVDRPPTSEYGTYYHTYIQLVPAGDVMVTLRRQYEDWRAFFRDIPDSLGTAIHPPYTWSINEVVGHMADSERVFGYRALRIARADTTPLAGFDENEFVRQAEFNRCRLSALVEEHSSVRLANLHLFQNIPEPAWTRMGMANGLPVSARAIPFIIAGHTFHHLRIVKQRLGRVSWPDKCPRRIAEYF